MHTSTYIDSPLFLFQLSKSTQFIAFCAHICIPFSTYRSKHSLCFPYAFLHNQFAFKLSTMLLSTILESFYCSINDLARCFDGCQALFFIFFTHNYLCCHTSATSLSYCLHTFFLSDSLGLVTDLSLQVRVYQCRSPRVCGYL